MLVDALGVDERELGQCLFPVGDDLALDESSGCFALVGLRLTPKSGQVVVWSGGLEGRLVGLSGQVVFVL